MFGLPLWLLAVVGVLTAALAGSGWLLSRSYERAGALESQVALAERVNLDQREAIARIQADHAKADAAVAANAAEAARARASLATLKRSITSAPDPAACPVSPDIVRALDGLRQRRAVPGQDGARPTDDPAGPAPLR